MIIVDCKATKNHAVLEQNMSSKTTLQGENEQHAGLIQLIQNIPSNEKYLEKYESLKRVDCLNPYVQLLGHVTEDATLKEFLSTHARHPNTEASSFGGRMEPNLRTVSPGFDVHEMSLEDIPQFRQRLKEALADPPPESQARRADAKPPKSQHPNHHNPAMGDWYMKRPHLRANFNADSSVVSPFAAQLGPIPVSSQEHLVIDDVLSVLLGVEGDFIVADPMRDPYTPRTFSVSDSIDPSLGQLVQDILPAAAYYSIVMHFIHEKTQFEYGQVNHALCAGMSRLVREYTVSVGQMEGMFNAGRLSLQALWFYVQPTLVSMKILAEVAAKISESEAIGGRVLSLLHELTAFNSGDSTSHEICLYLIQTASVPYMEMLEKWVYKGVICDPYREFLVEDNETVERGGGELVADHSADYSVDYWERRYTICEERVPVFLERLANVVLRTGKYLNVIRECGVDVKSPHAEEIIYTVTERQYFEAIERAYNFSSRTLLDLLLIDNDLIGRLRSVKHYFLMDQGDFFVQLMDRCEPELLQDVNKIEETRIESLCELMVRTSSANVDPYKDDVGTDFFADDIYSHLFSVMTIGTEKEKEHWEQTTAEAATPLTGIKAFTFKYRVRWPVSLVLNAQALERYKLVFRHLFYCKHVERSLCKIWLCDKVYKSFVRSTTSSYSPAFTLRQRMLNCVQNLEYYMMVEVIEPNWLLFLASMTKVENIDDVLEAHHQFLSACLKDCMLTSYDLLLTVTRLMDVCMQFCDFLQSPELAASEDSGEGGTYTENVQKFDTEFTSLLIGLLNQIRNLGRESNNEKLISVLYRLDFNNFYSMRLKQISNVTLKSTGDTSG